MNEIQIFKYTNDRNIRVIEKDGTPWFVAKDVCDVLGLTNNRKALQTLEEDELMLLRVTSGGEKREINGVNESGLYNLIFKSNKPEAKKFRRWVTHEVLPDIRKHGIYLSNKAIEAAQNTPEEFNAVVKSYIAEKQKREALEEKLKEEAPYATLGRVVVGLPGSVTIADVAQILAQRGIRMGRNRLYKFLREKKLVSSQKKRWNKPTQQGIEQGFMNLELVDPEKGYQLTPRTMVASKGVDYLTKMLFAMEYPLASMFENGEFDDYETEEDE